MEAYIATVIIPTYNRLDELRLTLNSLVVQECKYKFEVIVADDGSQEDALTIVRQYEEKLDIKYCYQPDKGFQLAATRNMGIKLAKGKICIFLDNGILLHSKAVERHINAHLSQESPCAIIGYIYGYNTKSIGEDEAAELKRIIDENTPDDAIILLKNKNIIDVRERKYKELGDDISKWGAPFVVFWCGNASVSKETLERVGMFDEWYNTWGGEDNHLGVALFANKIRFVLLREASSLHYPHDRNESNLWETDRDAALAESNRKKAYMLSKYPIPAMKLWMTEVREVELNRKLMDNPGGC